MSTKQTNTKISIFRTLDRMFSSADIIRRKSYRFFNCNYFEIPSIEE